MAINMISHKQVRAESVVEEAKTVEYLQKLNAEINVTLEAELAKLGVKKEDLKRGDLEMFTSQDGRCRDFFYKRRLLLQLRTEVKTDGSLGVHLIHNAQGHNKKPRELN